MGYFQMGYFQMVYSKWCIPNGVFQMVYSKWCILNGVFSVPSPCHFTFWGISLSSTEIPGVFNPGYSQRCISVVYFFRNLRSASLSLPKCRIKYQVSRTKRRINEDIVGALLAGGSIGAAERAETKCRLLINHLQEVWVYKSTRSMGYNRKYKKYKLAH